MIVSSLCGAYEETGIDRESYVYRFYPYDSEVYWFPDLVTWYYTLTHDPYQDTLFFPFEVEDFEFLLEDLEEELNEDETEVCNRDEELYEVKEDPNAFFYWEWYKYWFISYGIFNGGRGSIRAFI